MSDKQQPPQALARIRALSHLLDNAVSIPGTNYRIGLDPLLGLLPAAGDYVSAALSGYVVIEAARLGASKATLGRMVLNIIIDTLIGTFPILGDFFDFAWKANARNVALLESQVSAPKERERSDWWFVILLLVILALVLIGITALVVLIIQFLIALLSSSGRINN